MDIVLNWIVAGRDGGGAAGIGLLAAARGTRPRAGHVWWTRVAAGDCFAARDLVVAGARLAGPPSSPPASSAPLVVVPARRLERRRRCWRGVWIAVVLPAKPCGFAFDLRALARARRALPSRWPPRSKAGSGHPPAHGWRSRARAHGVQRRTSGGRAGLWPRPSSPCSRRLLDTLTDTELEQVLVHEWAHVHAARCPGHVGSARRARAGRAGTRPCGARWAACASSARWRATKWSSMPPDRPRRMRRA